METVVANAIEDNDDGKLEDNGVDRSSSALSSPKQIANPVVYKLVRVEGDGRLVPATDDEVMEVEGFLEYENSEMRVVADAGQSLECISIERSSSGKLRLECSQGTAEADLAKLNAKFQYIEQMLQKVKEEEEKLRMCGSPVHSHVNIDIQSCDEFPVKGENVQSETPNLEIPSTASSLNYTHSNQSGSTDQCSRPSEAMIESGSSASAVCSILKPDLSMLEGEICLDKLSIRELHELFKVTFGRETTVKDKQWLKRRIAMSLTNSCDVSATTFIVKDNKIVKKYEEDSSGNVNAVAGCGIGDIAREHDANIMDAHAFEGCGIEDKDVSKTRLRNHNMEHELGVEDHQTEERAAKRIRKPTKRYIEELSENESRENNPRFSSSKSMGLGHISPTSRVRPARNVFPEAKTFITRIDTLGGYDVQIPCASQVRKSRPRKDMKSLMKFHSVSMGEAEHGSDAGSESADKALKSRSTSAKLQKPSASEPGKEKQHPVMGSMPEWWAKYSDPSGEPEDNRVPFVPTAKGGMRRKHHRAWTIVEVMKLVEGVSQCGAGRWSEIKRLSFSSYSYRTSVDLKDKWRNLLKAAQTTSDDGINSRKQGTVPIPETILMRVRELAERNSQAPPNYSSNSSKLSVGAGNVQEGRAGFL